MRPYIVQLAAAMDTTALLAPREGGTSSLQAHPGRWWVLVWSSLLCAAQGWVWNTCAQPPPLHPHPPLVRCAQVSGSVSPPTHHSLPCHVLNSRAAQPGFRADVRLERRRHRHNVRHPSSALFTPARSLTELEHPSKTASQPGQA